MLWENISGAKLSNFTDPKAFELPVPPGEYEEQSSPIQCELYGTAQVLNLAYLLNYAFSYAKICSIMKPKSLTAESEQLIVWFVTQGVDCRFRVENTGKTKEFSYSNSSHFTSVNFTSEHKDIHNVFFGGVWFFRGGGCGFACLFLCLFLIELHWCIDLRATVLHVVTARLTNSFLWQGEIGRPGRKVWIKVLSQ